MTRRLRGLDRVVVLLVGLLLLVGGLAAVDWHQRLVPVRWLDWTDWTGWPDALDLGPVRRVVDTSWWPWAFAGGGVLLGLLGLRWLLAHLRRSGPSRLRTSASGPAGRVVVDLGSVAAATAAELRSRATVTDVRGRVRPERGVAVVEVRGRVDPSADPAAVVEAATTCAGHVAAAFPDDPVRCRVLLDAPSRRGSGGDRVRVS